MIQYISRLPRRYVELAEPSWSNLPACNHPKTSLALLMDYEPPFSLNKALVKAFILGGGPPFKQLLISSVPFFAFQPIQKKIKRRKRDRHHLAAECESCHAYSTAVESQDEPFGHITSFFAGTHRDPREAYLPVGLRMATPQQESRSIKPWGNLSTSQRWESTSKLGKSTKPPTTFLRSKKVKKIHRSFFTQKTTQ